jgi:branched-chain amino acid transport system substrate-binding protein
MKHFAFGLLIAACIAPGVAQEAPAAATPSGAAWVVGQSAPLTGSNAEFGKDIRDGARAYFEMVNRSGGINGARVELVTLDDGNRREKATENSAALLARKDVSALFGYASATLSLDSLPLAEAAQTIFFAPFTGATPIRKFNPILFNLRASYGDEVEKMVDIWTSAGFGKITVVHYDDEVGRQNMQLVVDYLNRLNKESVAFSIKRNEKVDDKLIERLIASGPQVLIHTVLSEPAANITLRLRESGRMIPTSSISFVGAQQLLDLVKEQGAGMAIAQVVPNPAGTLPVVQECSRALSALNVGKRMNSTHLEACIGAKVLTEAMRRTKRVGDRKGVLEAMRNLGTYDTGGFTVSYAPNRPNGSKFVDIAYVSRDGKLRF